jgi:hypothetical protein
MKCLVVVGDTCVTILREIPRYVAECEDKNLRMHRYDSVKSARACARFIAYGEELHLRDNTPNGKPYDPQTECKKPNRRKRKKQHDL